MSTAPGGSNGKTGSGEMKEEERGGREEEEGRREKRGRWDQKERPRDR